MTSRIKNLHITVPDISRFDARNLAEDLSESLTKDALQNMRVSGETHIRVKMKSHEALNRENIIRAVKDAISRGNL